LPAEPGADFGQYEIDLLTKTIQVAAGRPRARRVMTVEERVVAWATPSQMAPASRRLAHWRDFADFFEIV